MKRIKLVVAFTLTLSLLSFPSLGFQSDELLLDDEEFGLEGAPQPRSPEPIPTRSPSVTTPTRKRHLQSYDFQATVLLMRRRRSSKTCSKGMTSIG